MFREPNEGGGRATSKPEVIIVHETVLKSWMRDASTFILFAALIGIGVLLQSVALQWVGAIIAFITISAKATNVGRSYSIPQARAKLDQLEVSHD
ncbi:hypothetical protein DKP76_07290 [Falsochrobactrum shanghaiense]|uniref:Uncharacterized protein n=1 Tax=Falsochrobactrum shanghaiense TaxID=2201899 RepID=A0A316JC55_9HYPH|nr:hypothetical protein [Falsochrobactrum shanghaiense]PWL18858.1 hypothetical protein DKP76_07290 [Falsochrobactrum shanghaiense]